ncbi:dynamin family protein [Clostridium aestuarii]|uniref:Dynamin family protein n=1 Tax=Clostridium aestuarii TaxID=338193 RepID=A0ABT4D3K4_9CLOT|nr:dynamin family protein [Clostridium aestuarii]MCY6485826.1 dynamin family protein [Clostridium aestuarii]
MSFQSYKRKKQEVVELLKNIREKIPVEGVVKIVDQKIRNIENDRFIISIFGHFSNGKSTFLNALMGFGEEILVEDDLPSTAAITKLRAPESEDMLNKAQVIFTNGNKEIIDIKELGKYSAANEEYEVETQIKEVTLFLDSEYLKNGIEIVDTPGFNSTHTVHTEIAKNHVEKSDASIYMFSYDKPGADEEFKFLNYVNKYMNRIFFVVNKIDLCDKTENTVEKTVEELRSKLLIKKVNIEGKEIYPISAKLAKEAISEESEAKKKHSKFEYFKDALGNYLTSEDNLKDRLFEPLSVVQERLKAEREALQDKITACSKDNEELMKELENKKALIGDCEKELKEKKINIKNSVRNVIRNSKANFESSAVQIIDEIKEELSEINSEFDVALADFSGMAIGVYDKFIRNWNNIRINLEDDFIRIIEENIDNDRELQKMENRLTNIIHTSLDIEKIDVSDPAFDFKELDKIDKQIQKRKNEYDRNREKLTRCRNDKTKIDMLTEEKEKLERDIEKLVDKKEMRLESIGEARPVYGTKTVNNEKKRKGILGCIGNALFGPKVVREAESYVDYSSVEFVEKQREKIQSQYSVQVSAQEKKLESKIYEMMAMGDIENQLIDMEFESKEARRIYLDSINKGEEEKTKISQKIIKVSRDNYFKEIKKVCDEYVYTINNFLDNQRNLITNIIEKAIQGERKKLDNMKENLYSITTLANKTPEELQEEMKILYKQLDDVVYVMNEIQEYKEKM